MKGRSLKLWLSFILLGLSQLMYGQGTSAKSELPKGWHLLDKDQDGFYGISLNKAYEFARSKKLKSKTVVVAVIDSGVDTLQEDLKDILWVNPKEIPGNGIDDDHNGYVDDIHGWDFLGGKDGKVDYTETTEEVRQYYRLKDKYATITTAPAGQEKEYAFWQTVKTTYDSTTTKDQNEIKQLTTEVNVLSATNYYIKR